MLFFISLSPSHGFALCQTFGFIRNKGTYPIQQRNTDFDVVPVCASAIQIVRPLELIVEIQPQLQPVLLRLSAMISAALLFTDCSERFAVRTSSRQAGRSLPGFVPLIQRWPPRNPDAAEQPS